MTGMTLVALGFAAIIVFGTAAACLYDSLEERLPALRSTPYGGADGARRPPPIAARRGAWGVPTASGGPRRHGAWTGRERRSGTRGPNGPERRGMGVRA